MKEAHDRFGALPWSDLFQPAIDLARNGWEMYNYTAHVVELKVNFFLKISFLFYNIFFIKTAYFEDPDEIYGWNWEPYLDADGKVKKMGDTVIDLELANTLERLANDETKDTFYNGDLAEDIAKDLLGESKQSF